MVLRSPHRHAPEHGRGHEDLTSSMRYSLHLSANVIYILLLTLVVASSLGNNSSLREVTPLQTVKGEATVTESAPLGGSLEAATILSTADSRGDVSGESESVTSGVAVKNPVRCGGAAAADSVTLVPSSVSLTDDINKHSGLREKDVKFRESVRDSFGNDTNAGVDASRSGNIGKSLRFSVSENVLASLSYNELVNIKRSMRFRRENVHAAFADKMHASLIGNSTASFEGTMIASLVGNMSASLDAIVSYSTGNNTRVSFRDHKRVSFGSNVNAPLLATRRPNVGGRTAVDIRIVSDGVSRNYSYQPGNQTLSWVEAESECTARGGHLASLNTPDEWKAVISYLTDRKESSRNVYFGLRTAIPTLPFMYLRIMQWADESIAYFFDKLTVRGQLPRCSYFTPVTRYSHVQFKKCHEASDFDFLCEFPPRNAAKPQNVRHNSAIRFVSLPETLLSVPAVECPAGHMTHAFLACDEKSACYFRRSLNYSHAHGERAAWGLPSRTSCPVPMTSLPAMFPCGTGSRQSVPYSLVCNHLHDCAGGDDETFCSHPSCSGSTPLRCATSSQCFALNAYCDRTKQCLDGTDEAHCGAVAAVRGVMLPPPAVVSYKSHMFFPDFFFNLKKCRGQANTTTLCEETHFQCPGNGYYLPVLLRCNGVVDCPGREDEAGCELSECPGYFRCRGSWICLHANSVCDDVSHCPEQDDERFCRLSPCPQECTCHGLAFTCTASFAAGTHPEIRYLDAKDSEIGVGQLSNNTMLVHLSLAGCGVRALGDFVFPNLRSVDLSDNRITEISVKHLHRVDNLQVLVLSGNPLEALFSNERFSFLLERLETVDLARTSLAEINIGSFVAFPGLINLNISHSFVGKLYRTDSRSLSKLRVLDMSHSHVNSFQRDMISKFSHLESLFAESYTFCCPVLLPPMFNLHNCHAPPDHVSSCDSLLASSAPRLLLVVFCCFALLGNSLSLAVRIFVIKSSGFTSTDVFLTHLAVADALLGVCVAVVVIAGRLYQGNYVLEDTAWRESVTCKTVGFLHLLSSQLSQCMVFLVTLGALASRMSSPRWRGVSLLPGTARVVCRVVWVGGVFLAAVPLLPRTSAHWELFGQSGACFSLLVTVDCFDRPGKASFVGVVVVFASLLAVFIAAGQACIRMKSSCSTAINNFMLGDTQDKCTPGEKTMCGATSNARCVSLPCLLNVACWLLLCLLAALAARGSPLPDWLHVQAGLIALPVASALRPFVHALGVWGESQRRQRAERLMTLIKADRRQRGKNVTKATE